MEYLGRKVRHELKYYIHQFEYEAMRNRLRPVVQHDRHSVSEDGYHIRSLYFDNSSDTALHDKNKGILRRYKYRIRIYNKSDQSIKLERKSKQDSYVWKETVQLTREEYERILRGDVAFLRDSPHPIARDFYYRYTWTKMEPRVIVDYMREAYVCEQGDVRITFDKELMSGVNSLDIFDPNLVTVEAIHEPKMIVEVKYLHYVPSHVKSLMQLERHQRSAISKYVICREESMNYYNR